MARVTPKTAAKPKRIDRRLYPESKIPMSEEERALYIEANEKHYLKCRKAGRVISDSVRLAHVAGDRAAKRSRGAKLFAEERTLDLFAVR